MFNPWIIVVWLFSLGLAIGGGWMLRGDHESGKQLKAVEVAAVKGEKLQVGADTLAGKLAGNTAAQVTKDRIITREVVRYVQVTPDADRCTLPGTWRVRHDAAATGAPAESASGAVDSPAGSADAAPVTDAAALETVSENYIACRGYIRQVKGWQAFWDSIKSAFQEGRGNE